jgi:hypothetical protein
MSLLIKGVTQFIKLTDTPDTYAAAGGYIAKVKATLDGLEFGNAVTQYQIPTNIVPDNVGLITSLTTAGRSTTRMRIAGKYAVMAEGVPGVGYVTVIDVARPDNPLLCKRYAPSPNSVQALAVAGRYIYCITTGDKKLWVIDWSDPYNLQTVGSLSITDTDVGTGLFVRGRYAYVTHSWTTHGIDIVDISNPTSPVRVGGLNDATYFLTISDIVVIANTAYVVSKNYISTINVADPTNT